MEIERRTQKHIYEDEIKEKYQFSIPFELTNAMVFTVLLFFFFLLKK